MNWPDIPQKSQIWVTLMPKKLVSLSMSGSESGGAIFGALPGNVCGALACYSEIKVVRKEVVKK